MQSAAALAHPNIAFIKYWGNRDDQQRLPANGSISMNLGGLFTRAEVTFNESFQQDSLLINEKIINNAGLQRVSTFLGKVRQWAGINAHAKVISESNFPTGAGIASSASAFAALALAASKAAGLNLNEVELSRLARSGSGSACRSVPAGFVEWQIGVSDKNSYAKSIAPASHWKLMDCVALIDSKQKFTGSSEGHGIAATSPLQAARILDTPRRLDICRRAIMDRDFPSLAEIVELDSNLMHAVMMTSCPPLFYWQAVTLTIIQAVRTWQKDGLPVCYSIDAGPNVHILTEQTEAERVTGLLKNIAGVSQVLVAGVGGPAQFVEKSL